MMEKPLITMIREAIRARLLESEELRAFVSNTHDDEPRIFLNFYEAWEEAELTVIGIYAVSEQPVENDYHPPRDERQVTIKVEIITREDEAMEARLDVMAAIVEAYLTLDPLGRIITANGGPDTLLEIKWQGNERGYLPEGPRTLGANVMTFAMDYTQPPPGAELPNFLSAYSQWVVAETKAEDLTDIPQEERTN